ncbi:hypothetical protein [uncultured Shewanella sp.]|uniref:hypothetical protein n=1 Tax=uncultured Shewanella sp. TaxID=173975 RepID=UPI00261CE962|nr:hypothetical protein [uncultured Shewanella sp.]
MGVELSIHLEAMNHEICNNSSIIECQGYRVDGDRGIKVVVGLAARKSVDYFFELNGSCTFVEFSDLARGQEDLLGLKEKLDTIEPAFHRSKLQKLLKTDSRRELIEKFKDSKDIYAKIPTFYNEPPAYFICPKPKVFYIVHAPISEKLSDSEKAEIARFLTTLKSTVSASLEDDICSRVKLLLLEQFIEEIK